MQISTYFRNYLIDCLELRNDMHILNEVFTSPSILKVTNLNDFVFLLMLFKIFRFFMVLILTFNGCKEILEFTL